MTESSLTTDALQKEIKRILKNGDTSTLTSKKVRQQLESVFDSDLTDRKKEIDSLLMQCLEENDDEENGDDVSDQDHDSISDNEPVPKKSKVSKPSHKLPKGRQPSSNSEDSDDSDKDDAKLARKLQGEEGKRPSRLRKKSAKRKSSGGSRAGKSTYSKPCQLSDDLADIMGTDKMARSEVVKKMWAIVKERNLADPKNKRFHICDDQLLKVFGTRRVQTFAMMKYLKPHIMDIKDD